MEVINISKKRYENLESLQLPTSVFNGEAQMYILPIKNKNEIVNKLLKRLNITRGPILGNKLQTINSLVDLKEKIDIPEIVFPEKLAVVDNQIVGYIMELVESIDLETAIISPEISPERKIKYLRQIGEILEKMKNVRKNYKIKDFYLNDMHEHNFIIENKTDNVRVVDIDSCKINGNYTFGSRYLSPMSLISKVTKYQKETNGICGGYIVPSEDTDLYCYIIMILNTLFDGCVYRFTIDELYIYLNYLETIGVNSELLTIFENIITDSPNKNPYKLLDSLVPILPKANYNEFRRVRKK